MPVFPLWEPADITVGTVDFDLADFLQALWQKGRRLIWEQALSCPCRRKIQLTQRAWEGVAGELINEPRIECPGCAGAGIRYVNRQPTIGMLTDAMQDQKLFNLFSRYSEGTVFITTLPAHLPAPRDRLTLTNGVVPYEETNATYIEGQPTRARFPVIKHKRLVGAERDPTEMQTVELGVEFCCAADLDGNLLPQVYEEGVNFDVVDGVLVWRDDATRPPDGARLSFRYTGRPVFTVVAVPSWQRDLFQNDAASIEDRELGQHPFRVIAVPEFWGGRNPPVSADVLDPEPEPHKAW